MPYVVKHASGQSPYWYAVFRDETGKRRKRSTKETSKSKALEIAYTLQRAAREARQRALTEARTRDLLSEILKSVNGEGLRTFTVEQWFDLFVKQKQKSRADKTALRHAQMMREFVRFLGYRAKLNLAVVTSKDIADFRDRRESFGLAPSTLNGDVTVLSAAFNAALRQGHISVNPCLAIEPVKDKAGAKKHTFALEQVTALGHVADGDWKGLILVGFYTGQRLGDSANLQWKQVDLKSKIKTIRFKQGKTGCDLIIVINPVLEEYLSGLAESKADEVFVFPSLANRNISPLSKHFRKLMERAGIEQHVIRERGNSDKALGRSAPRRVNALSFHSLRHTFNSILANARVPEETRMALTGHTTREQNQTYTHRQLTTLQEAVAVLPRVTLNPRSPSFTSTKSSPTPTATPSGATSTPLT
jgi:integrase